MPEFEARDHALQVNVVGDNTGTINAGVHHHEAAPPPRQPITSSLPADSRTVLGRDRELRQILAAADGSRAVSIYAIDGLAGVGKTTLAIRAAHELAMRFPDGQYFVELHAHTPGRQAADPSDVLAGLLIELGLDPRNIPDTLTGRRDLWRNRLATKKALIVLDDVADRGQIEPLVPSGPDCLTLVTSRRRLLLLKDMQPLALRVLDVDSAADLFRTVAHRGSLGDGERDVARRIAELCGCLPLAVVLVAGRIAHHPDWTTAEITELAEEFDAATDRLAELDAGGSVVRAAFDLSYRELPPERRLLFRRLGLHPGPDLDASAAAALAAVDVTTARRELQALYSDHLLDETARGRYRLHDLLRVYARTLTTTDAADDTIDAMDRLLNYYQHTAAAADARLTRQARPTANTIGGVEVPEFGEMRALAWMRRERANLLACLEHTTGRDPGRMVTLTEVVAGLLQRDGPWPLARDLHQRAADASAHLGDRLAHANALGALGDTYWRTGAYGQAADLYQRALGRYREISNRLGEANTLVSLGNLRKETGDHSGSAALYRQALGHYREIGNRQGEANSLGNLGLVFLRTADHDQATDLHQQALAVYREIGNRLGEANSLGNLGLVHMQTGDYARAADLQQQALALHRELGYRLGEANALNNLGFVCQRTGNYAQAADLHEQALILHRELGNRLGEANSFTNLGLMRMRTSDYAQAADLQQQALALHRELGNRLGEANALNNLGLVRQRTGDHAQAADLHQQALVLFRELGHRSGEAAALNEIGTVLLAAGEPAKALTAFTDAVGLARDIGSQREQARALDGSARSSARLGDTSTAVTELRRATEIYRRLGVPEVDTASAYLAELESRLPPDRHARDIH
ncbi:ATP-binding protein [Nocardia sp. NPDC049526]|uniref:ATP-binding protein n=1 Tax=Nocardia sp. NPDC049526 TaxID=3364316 RepID=UPI0037A1FDCE